MGVATRAGDGAPAARWLARRWIRRRWVGVVPLLVIVLVGVTATLVTVDAARRTAAAYGRYLERANAGDVVVNPSVSTVDIDAVIRSLPGVTEVSTEALFMVTRDEGAPRTRGEVDQGNVESGVAAGVFGSHDGRYFTMDRPVVDAGRLPVGPSELALSVTLAEAEGLAVGDVIPLAFWNLGPEDGLGHEEVARRAQEMVEPVGVEHVTLVGLITLPDEVLPTELYSRARAIVSPDIARRYDCLGRTPDPARTLAENIERHFPRDCAVSYRYYSLSFADGTAGVKPALEEFVRRTIPLNAALAKIEDTSGGGASAPEYFLIAKETDPERQRVARATRPTVAALGVLATASAAMTVALAALAVGRELRRTRPAQRQWRHLGLTRPERAAVAVAPPLLAIVAGVVGGLVAASLLRIGPVGLVRVVEPDPPRGIEAGGLLAAAAAIGVGCVAIAMFQAARASRMTEVRSGRGSTGRLARRFTAVASPAVADGVRAAFGQRVAAPVVAGIGLVTAALVAALVFGTNLSSLVDTPRSYGWTWDVAAMTGGGYGDLDVEGARAAFDRDPAVANWTAFGFLNQLSIDGEPVVSVVGAEREVPAVAFPVLEGELPGGPDEIALGSLTAGERGLDVGDTVRLGGPFDSFDVTISGLVVFPAVGPMFAESMSAGVGMLVPQVLVDAVAPPGAAADLATFVAVELAEDADGAAIERVRRAFDALDLLGSPPIRYDRPIRPPEVIEAAATRSVPVAVGAGLAAGGAFALGAAAWASARTRRRDLAVLRALGFGRGQVRASVRVQSMATMLAALVVGVPLGVVAGRLSWRAFAGQLGVVPDTTTSWPVVGLVGIAALVIALVAAELPARRAAATRAAAGLRAE